MVLYCTFFVIMISCSDVARAGTAPSVRILNMIYHAWYHVRRFPQIFADLRPAGSMIFPWYHDGFPWYHAGKFKKFKCTPPWYHSLHCYCPRFQIIFIGVKITDRVFRWHPSSVILPIIKYIFIISELRPARAASAGRSDHRAMARSRTRPVPHPRRGAAWRDATAHVRSSEIYFFGVRWHRSQKYYFLANDKCFRFRWHQIDQIRLKRRTVTMQRMIWWFYWLL